MIRPRIYTLIAALSLLEVLGLALAHGHGDDDGEPTDMGAAMTIVMTSALPTATANSSGPATGGSYLTHPAMGGTMLGHIVVMTVAWFFMLPIGKCKNPNMIRVADFGRHRHYVKYCSLATCASRPDLLPWRTQHRPCAGIDLYPYYA